MSVHSTHVQDCQRCRTVILYCWVVHKPASWLVALLLHGYSERTRAATVQSFQCGLKISSLQMFSVWIAIFYDVPSRSHLAPSNPFLLSKHGLVRDLNPGPRAPEARIIPLDQRAGTIHLTYVYILTRTSLLRSRSLTFLVDNSDMSMKWRHDTFLGDRADSRRQCCRKLVLRCMLNRSVKCQKN